MNTRFLSTAKSWFGGGADLTPLLDEQRSQDADDAVLFHAAMQAACDALDPVVCEVQEVRRVLLPAAPQRAARRRRHLLRLAQVRRLGRDFAFTRRVGEAFLDVYPKIVRHRMDEPWTEADRDEQLVRRGRYVEFNLLYDRGTMFGLQQGGNIDDHALLAAAAGGVAVVPAIVAP